MNVELRLFTCYCCGFCFFIGISEIYKKDAVFGGIFFGMAVLYVGILLGKWEEERKKRGRESP